MSKSISYALTVCNELEEITKLVTLLRTTLRDEDEIIIQYDDDSVTPEVLIYLDIIKNVQSNIKVINTSLGGDFSKFKNNLKDNCTKDYIFQIDADELVSQFLLLSLPSILENNDVDIIIIPRINTVDNITDEWVKKWGWSISKMESLIEHSKLDLDSDEYKLLKNNNLIIEEMENDMGNFDVKHYKPIINFPDVQFRILKNSKDIKWENKVHETLNGYQTFTILPLEPQYCLLHPKKLDRQIKQNQFYDTIG